MKRARSLRGFGISRLVVESGVDMTPFQLFVSYSHNDETYLSELEKHLSTLKREKLIDTWCDRKITPGKNWEGEIDDALQRSDVIVFLISPDFIASEYCIEKEVAAALERHSRGDAVVIPIVVRPVDWLSTPIGKIQALPRDAEPVSMWGDKDQAWLEVTKGIRAAINVLNNQRMTAPIPPMYCGISQALTAEIERLEQRCMSNSSTGGVPTGIHDLDTLIDGLHPGDLVFVAAAPGSDRVGVLDSIVSHILVNKSVPGMIFTLRHSKEHVARRLCSAISSIPVSSLLRGELEDEDWSRLTYALGMINDKAIVIVDKAHLDISTVILQIDKFIAEQGECGLVVIEHFDHVVGGNSPELLSILSRYARTNNISIIVSCGLKRDPSSRPNKRPVLSDIGEWAALNNDLDIVILTHLTEQFRPEVPERFVAEVIVAKNPRGAIGIVSAAHLKCS